MRRSTHFSRIRVGLVTSALLGSALIAAAASVAAAQPVEQGKEEFGMTPRQLVQAIEKVEAAIEKCMRTQGFQYIAVDYDTVRKGMQSFPKGGYSIAPKKKQ